MLAQSKQARWDQPNSVECRESPCLSPYASGGSLALSVSRMPVIVRRWWPSVRLCQSCGESRKRRSRPRSCGGPHWPGLTRE